jgi:hypothetical protein
MTTTKTIITPLKNQNTSKNTLEKPPVITNTPGECLQIGQDVRQQAKKGKQLSLPLINYLMGQCGKPNKPAPRNRTAPSFNISKHKNHKHTIYTKLLQE